MLELLRITNYAIIDQLEIELPQEFTVITGETGAGKSIMLGALRLLLGDRATAETLRTGAQRATIEGIFTNLPAGARQWLTEHAYDLEDPQEADTLTVRRDIMASGTSRNVINGNSATLAQLRELGEFLVDLHGQNDQARLNSPATQLALIDSFGDHAPLLEAYQAAYRAWQHAHQRYHGLTQNQFDAQKRKDFLQFQVEEIEQAELRLGEDAELEQELKRLANAQRLQETVSQLIDLLYEGENTDAPVNTQMATATRLLQDLAQMDDSQTALAEQAESLRYGVEDLTEKLRDYINDVVGDPERLSLVDDRLQLIRNLKRKYGSSIDLILETGAQLRRELDDIINHDEALEQATAALEATITDLRKRGDALTKARARAAGRFQEQVQVAIRELELPKAVLEVRLTPNVPEADAPAHEQEYSASGLDRCEFMVSLNAGEAPKPMRKTASGGELSRIILAMKSILAEKDEVPTLIFDEIDTGISGKAASRVGQKLLQLAATHQVLTITHLPQIAALGTHHLVVEKLTRDEKTATSVTPIDGARRTQTIATMISGHDTDEESLKFAETLLKRPVSAKK